jgi:hypothetical protein
MSGSEYRTSLLCHSQWRKYAANLAAPPETRLTTSKVTLFGALLCLDNFLYNFTILPLRAASASVHVIHSLISRQSGETSAIAPNHLRSIFRLMLLVIPTIVLLAATDASKMYHAVRGQDTIKLYVIFNALEVSQPTYETDFEGSSQSI